MANVEGFGGVGTGIYAGVDVNDYPLRDLYARAVVLVGASHVASVIAY